MHAIFFCERFQEKIFQIYKSWSFIYTYSRFSWKWLVKKLTMARAKNSNLKKARRACELNSHQDPTSLLSLYYFVCGLLSVIVTRSTQHPRTQRLETDTCRLLWKTFIKSDREEKGHSSSAAASSSWILSSKNLFFIGMERWWQNAISPIRRVWIRVANRIGMRKNGKCCYGSISCSVFFSSFEVKIETNRSDPKLRLFTIIILWVLFRDSIRQ